MVCVIAKLEEDANARLSSLRAAVLPRGLALPPLYGHITLATCLDEKPDAFIRDCAAALAGSPPFTVRYERIGMFAGSGVIYAEPIKSPRLSSMHRMIAERYGQVLDQWTRGEDWFPHTTLIAVPVADPGAVCRAMQRLFVPFDARIGRVEFSLVGEEGFAVVEGVDLK